MKSSQEYRSNLSSCIRHEARADRRIRIPAIVIRITIARAAIRSIVPITAGKKLRQ